MTLDALIMGAGTLVAILPFLGFPQSWKTILFCALGIFIIAVGIAVRRGGWKNNRMHGAPQAYDETHGEMV
jgi:uncharacterized membrane protein